MESVDLMRSTEVVDHRRQVAKKLAGRGDIRAAVAICLDLAGDPSAASDDRRKAALALVELGAPEKARSALTRVAGDFRVSAKERRKSAVALAGSGAGETAGTMLADLASDSGSPSTERRKAALALLDLGLGDLATEVLLGLADAESVRADERIKAALVLNRLDHREAATRCLLQVASHTGYRAADRVRAALDLVSLGQAESSGEILTDIAQNTTLYINDRALAAVSLARFADHATACKVMVSLFDQPNFYWRSAWLDCAAALRGMGYADVAARLLLQSTRDHAPFEHDLKVARFLLECGYHAPAVERLVSLASDQAWDYRTRVRAVQMLFRLGHPRATELLIRLGTDTAGNRELRRAASMLLSLGDLDRASKALRRLANDRYAGVPERIEAIVALKAIGHGEPALRAARDWAKGQRISYQLMGAALSLARLGRRAEAGEKLRRSLATADHKDTRLARVLAQIGYPEDAAAVMIAWAGDSELTAYTRCEAAIGAAGLGRADDAAAALLDMADQDSQRYSGIQIASALATIGRRTEARDVLRRTVLRQEGNFPDPLYALERVPGRRGTAAVFAEFARDVTVRTDLRLHAALALRRLGQVREGRSVLAELAADPAVSAWIRVRAAGVLAEAAGSRRQAVKVLRTVAADLRVAESVRESAFEALQRMET